MSRIIRFFRIFCRLPRNCEHHFPLLASNFSRGRKLSVSLKAAVQRQKIRENKTCFVLKKVFLPSLALPGRFGVRGAKPRNFCFFWLQKKKEILKILFESLPAFLSHRKLHETMFAQAKGAKRASGTLLLYSAED